MAMTATYTPIATAEKSVLDVTRIEIPPMLRSLAKKCPVALIRRDIEAAADMCETAADLAAVDAAIKAAEQSVVKPVLGMRPTAVDASGNDTWHQFESATALPERKLNETGVAINRINVARACGEQNVRVFSEAVR